MNTKAKNLADYIPAYLPLAFGFVFRQYAAEIVADKNNKIAVGMRMMGLRPQVGERVDGCVYSVAVKDSDWANS